MAQVLRLPVRARWSKRRMTKVRAMIATKINSNGLIINHWDIVFFKRGAFIAPRFFLDVIIYGILILRGDKTYTITGAEVK